MFGVAVVALMACGSGAAAARGCPATVPSARQRSAAPFSPQSFNYGSRLLRVQLPPRGRLPAGVLPDGGAYATIGPDGSIRAKVGWWSGRSGSLRITGRRLDRRAPPLEADVLSGYGDLGFIPTMLTFPTDGCWRITGSIGPTRLAFVLQVMRVGRSRR